MSLQKQYFVGVGLVTVLVVLGTTLGIVFARARNSVAALQPAPLTAQDHGRQPLGPVQVVRFTVYDAGIYPREARVNAGRVAVLLVDYSGGTNGLIIEREIGPAREHAGTGRRNGQHWRGREEFQLQAGTYRIHDASRPGNRATLIVEQ
ncbi:MAG: hypothetical protein ACR2H4_01760 [Pyrinomonadaceae bacterium]